MISTYILQSYIVLVRKRIINPKRLREGLYNMQMRLWRCSLKWQLTSIPTLWLSAPSSIWPFCLF